jgi:hypothetical protein
MTWPAQAAQREGIDIEIADGVPILRRPSPRGDLIKAAPLDADVLVFQRISDPEVLAIIPDLQARGHAIVVDVDDDLHSVPKTNAAYGFERPRNVLKACALADLVTVTTPALARRYAPHGRVAILPNCVPEAVLYLPRDSDGRTVGWGGWAGSHPGDLEITRGGVADAVDRADARFHVVGPADYVAERLGLSCEPTATGPLMNVAGYEFERALGALDVGIVPLADTTFNQAKSTLKGLQYAARGVAFVASPVAEYQRLAGDGIGVTAGWRSRSWRGRILELLTDDHRRNELAAQAKALVAERHTYEGNAWRWAEAWSEALARRRSLGRAAA